MPKRVLTIAGSDPSGGAGIQADLKVLALSGVPSAAVPTVLTIQNSKGVQGVFYPPVEVFSAALKAVFEDEEYPVVKVGAVGSIDYWKCILGNLSSMRGRTCVIVDPIFSPSRGASFCGESEIDFYRTQLPGYVSIITPNISEAALLLGWQNEQVIAEKKKAMECLVKLGYRGTVLKGGHRLLSDDCEDFLRQS